MRSDNKKPECPICGGEIEIAHMSFSSSGASSSVLLGGRSEMVYYECKNRFNVCKESVNIANAWFDHWGFPERNTKKGKDWREALKRYHHYCDFMDDNEKLKNKMLVCADKYGDLPKLTLIEEYPGYDPFEEMRQKANKKNEA